jgi:low affinity Fe/Cu permease
MTDGIKTPDKGFFDRFAESTAAAVSRAPFFAFCVLLILVWAPTFTFLPFDTWQLIINTVTTIVTFLLVALLQNSDARANMALQKKLDAQSQALLDVMVHLLNPDEDADFHEDIARLEDAVGLESDVGTKKDKG